MKFLVLGFCLLAVSVFAETHPSAETENAPVPAAQLEGERGEYLIGPLTRSQWEKFEPELAPETRKYEASPDLIEALSYGGNEITILCVLGTWCHDSRREVPRFWKILDAMGTDAFEMELVAVGRTDAPEALDWEIEHDVIPGYRTQYDIELVPTFIVMDAGEEIGRIIETPEITLEADLATILGVSPSPRMH